MELIRIDDLIEKYFRGETSIAEENELRSYFTSSNVAPRLEQYKSIFGYFSQAKEQSFTRTISFESKAKVTKRFGTWLSIAASVVILLGIGTYAFYTFPPEKQSQDLGTYDDPDEAFRATQKALSLLSNNVNVGIESVQYIKVYQTTKEKIFITNKKKSGGS